MKNSHKPLSIAILSVCFPIVTTISLCCKSDQARTDEKKIYGNENMQSDSLLKVKQIADKVWVIDESGTVNMYLVEGQDSALLIDTSTGAGNLIECIGSITRLPLIVVNTHGHPDHAGSNYRFEKIYAHPEDFEAVRQFSNTELRTIRDTGLQRDSTVSSTMASEDVEKIKPMVLVPVEQGYVFDLGNRKLEVIEVPGHTKGSICLLDSEHKILFSGDNNNVLVWLFLEGCTPLETYLQTLQKLKQREDEFDTIMPGHGFPLDKEFISEQITCAQNILDGSCQGEPYESFAGNGRVCYYKRAGIAYNPDNLYVQE